METLPNGLKIVFVPESHSEAVAFGIFVASGSRHETAKTAGISHFLEHMLFKGTAKRSALEISQSIEGKGGNFNAYTSEETTCLPAFSAAETKLYAGSTPPITSTTASTEGSERILSRSLTL